MDAVAEAVGPSPAPPRQRSDCADCAATASSTPPPPWSARDLRAPLKRKAVISNFFFLQNHVHCTAVGCFWARAGPGGGPGDPDRGARGGGGRVGISTRTAEALAACRCRTSAARRARARRCASACACDANACAAESAPRPGWGRATRPATGGTGTGGTGHAAPDRLAAAAARVALAAALPATLPASLATAAVDAAAVAVAAFAAATAADDAADGAADAAIDGAAIAAAAAVAAAVPGVAGGVGSAARRADRRGGRGGSSPWLGRERALPAPDDEKVGGPGLGEYGGHGHCLLGGVEARSVAEGRAGGGRVRAPSKGRVVSQLEGGRMEEGRRRASARGGFRHDGRDVRRTQTAGARAESSCSKGVRTVR